MKQTLIVISITLIALSCRKKEVPRVDYAKEMRDFVIEISNYGKEVNSDFLIIPQNGIELVTKSTEKDDDYAMDYLAAIDGYGQEELFYGYRKDDKMTPASVTNQIQHYLDACKENEVQVLVTDYCSTQENILDSYDRNDAKGYLCYAADERSLNNIPDYLVSIHNENDSNINALGDAQNFLYLINPNEKFADKATFISALNETNYDLIIMDYAFDRTPFTTAEIESLKKKKNGADRLVVSYMSIGEAEDYRYYWQSEWKKNSESPEWLYEENRKWRGNYKVFYWMDAWKNLIYAGDDAYLDRILEQGFDGAYLDIIDAYEFYENN